MASFLKKAFWFGVVFLYQLTPIDIATDLVPVIGSLDDLLVMYFGVSNCIASSPKLKAA